MDRHVFVKRVGKRLGIAFGAFGNVHELSQQRRAKAPVDGRVAPERPRQLLLHPAELGRSARGDGSLLDSTRYARARWARATEPKIKKTELSRATRWEAVQIEGRLIGYARIFGPRRSGFLGEARALESRRRAMARRSR